MTSNEPHEPQSVEIEKDLVSSQDWFSTFCKHLEFNYTLGENPRGFDLPSHQVPTLVAVLTTLTESGMVTQDIYEQIQKCIVKSDQPRQRTFGLSKNHLTIATDDDNEHLEHFEQYMP